MLFSDMRVKEIYHLVHYRPTILKFSASRETHILGIQLSGQANHFFSDRQFTLSENCLYFFNQNEGYDVEILERGVAFSVHFTSFAPIDTKSFCLPIKDNSQVVQLLDRIEYQFRLNSCTNSQALSDLYRLFALYEDIYYKKYIPSNRKVLDAKEYINLHFKEKNCIVKAAELYGVTQRRFTDIFRENFHITPNQYIVTSKIEYAKKLLSANEFSVSDVAELCGFNNVYYFSKTFKDRTGQTPSFFKNKGGT